MALGMRGYHIFRDMRDPARTVAMTKIGSGGIAG